MTTSEPASAGLQTLRDRCRGRVVGPGDEGWDSARRAWNLAVDQLPAAVAFLVDERDLLVVIDHARTAGLRVAPQATGHNAGPLGSLENTLLLKTSAMTGFELDPERRRARVRAGTTWLDVVVAAQPHGLAALSGTAPDISVVGYSLGGGLGWLGRRHGLQASSVLAVELVTAGGELVLADDAHEPELFWALRGGGGGFGVVTAMEFAVHPVQALQAGALVWDWRHAARVLTRWSAWAPTAPDEVTTTARIMQFPPLPEIPEPLRGRRVVMIDAVLLGDAAHADQVLRPLRALGPELDTVAAMPPAALVHIHGDPEQPVPAVSDHVMLDELPDQAVEAFVGLAGPGSGSPLLMAEFRQLGGALARVPARHGAVATLDGAFALYTVAVAMTPEMAAAGREHAARLCAALASWGHGNLYLNFTEHPADVGAGFDAPTLRRLQAVKAQVDPGDLVRANHAVPPL